MTLAKNEIGLELNKIHKLDALKGLAKLKNESCDIVIADPPYNIGKDFEVTKDKMEISEYVEWSKEWIDQCVRAMKPNATMFIYGFSEILAFLSAEIPLSKRWLIWHYTNKNVPTLNFWQRSHESIICCWKGKPVFNRDLVREPYTETFLKNAAGKIRNGTKGRFGSGKETIYQAHPQGALPRDVIKIPALAGGAGFVERVDHPTQKPLELCDRLIKSCRPPGSGIVLVPFVGSGSECVSAKRNGLDFIGFEINPKYVKTAEERIADAKRPASPRTFA
jgi:site-specific DNA-methyltransferase (adenine-specific)